MPSSDTGRFDKPIPLNPDGSPVEAGGEEKCTTVSKETTQTWTLVVPPLISFPGLLVDTIALFRLGACARYGRPPTHFSIAPFSDEKKFLPRLHDNVSSKR